ncbi:MAG: leucyl aminopeptidase [Bacteroidetes bacterium]|nr:leucyl aminopeptidase [Bacteroidota bacterium]
MAKVISKKAKSADVVLHIVATKDVKKLGLSKENVTYVQSEFLAKRNFVLVPSTQELVYVQCAGGDWNAKGKEAARKWGVEIQQAVNKWKKKTLLIVNHTANNEIAYCVAEGAALSNYQFLKYRKDKKEKQNSFESIFVQNETGDGQDLSELMGVVEGTELARTLINEPVSFLNAVQFAKEMQQAGKQAGFKTQVLNKKQIQALKMGGLLGVNQGSVDEPTFTIMEYKPKNAKNKKPVVLVGKGVVFDTGGLSLKPTPGSMDEMKCDMAGGAAVVGAMTAVASNKLPVWVVGLVPATDNRPGGDALAPQDIITISDGTTVEVLNTDAEGRLILADALVYAKKYNPELVIDLATLTGAAIRAIGTYASAVMANANQEVVDKLLNSGMDVWERMIQFPMWDEYGEEMKSDIADLKNLGGAFAGQISAAKFLEHFTNYPWIHIDIAGPAYQNAAQAYRTKGGVGVGVRSLYHFIKNTYAK